ncbi:unnamed protein product [Peniophora sp. CBMAI 1063]|nr:unnamed protein product [Peniophora sp. CBMAI 1063]
MSDALSAELTYIRDQVLLIRKQPHADFSIFGRALLNHLARGLHLCRLVADNAQKVLEFCSSKEREGLLHEIERSTLVGIVERRPRVEKSFDVVITGIIRYILYDAVTRRPASDVVVATRMCLPGHYDGPARGEPEPFWNVLEEETVSSIAKSYAIFFRRRMDWMERDANLSPDDPACGPALQRLEKIGEDFLALKDKDHDGPYDPEEALWEAIENTLLERMKRVPKDVKKVEAIHQAVLEQLRDE